MTDAIDSFKGDYAWLSNFWRVEIEYDGMKFPTVEHAYQAAKSRNRSARELIRVAETPGIAKRMGGRLDLRSDWYDIRVAIMAELLRQKFRDPTLRQKLLDTGDVYLAEGNTWGDVFWGVDTRSGKGKNRLGGLLMQIREEIREERDAGLREARNGEGSGSDRSRPVERP